MPSDPMEPWQATLGKGVDLALLSPLDSYRPDFHDTEDTLKTGGDAGSDETPQQGFGLLELLGAGGMGVVHRARQRSLGRIVAVKMLKPASKSPSASKIAGFLCEARIQGLLEHPNIIPIYELDVARPEAPGFAMKLVSGSPWEQVLQRGPGTEELEVWRAAQLEILLHVCHAIAYAHDKGILHNDLKPQNIMLGPFGEVLLVDWGLAVAEREIPDTPGIRLKEAIRSACGTPAYMPPELAEGRGEALGPWTDCYLLGGILYRIFVGHAPHAGRSFIEVATRAAKGLRPTLPSNLPQEVRAILERALASEPNERYRKVLDLRADLETYLRHRQSIELVETTNETLAGCLQSAAEETDQSGQSRLYDQFSQVVAGFVQSKKLWPENPRAIAGEDAARCAYAQLALRRGDVGFAQSQLEHLQAESAAELRLGIEQHLRRQQALRRGRRRLQLALGAACLLSLAIVIGWQGSESMRRTRLRSARLQQMDSLRAALAHAVRSDPAGAVQREIVRLTPPGNAPSPYLSPEERQTNATRIKQLVACATLKQELLAWALRPIAGEAHQLMPRVEQDSLRSTLHHNRRSAMQLAALNGSFDMSELIIAGASLEAAQRDRQLAYVDARREAQLASQNEDTRAALRDLREGRSRPGRPSWLPSPDEYVVRLSRYRHPSTVDILSAALQPYLERMRSSRGTAQSLVWGQPEREELEVILQVLGLLELPQFTLAPLSEFLRLVEDVKLAVVCGKSLCNTASSDAYAALNDFARERFGSDSLTWRKIERFLARLPLPESPRTPSVEALRVVAGARRARGDLEGALADLEQALALDGEHYEALNDAGIVRQALGDLAGARRDFDRALALRPEYVECLSNRATLSMDEGDLDAAIEDLSRALALRPDHPGILNNRGLCWRRLADYVAAVDDFSRALQSDPGFDLAYLNRGGALSELERYEEASLDFDRVIALDPDQDTAYQSRARARIKLGNFRGALADLDVAVRLDPDDAEGLAYRGELLAELGRPNEALRDFDAAIRLEPQAPDFLASRARIYSGLGELDRAIKDNSAALRLRPEEASYWHNRGFAYERLGQLEAAFDDYNQAIELDPALAPSLFNRGRLLLESGYHSEAIADFSRAIAAQPTMVDAYTNRAIARRSLGQLEEALEDVREAVRLEPSAVNERFVLTELLEQLQRFDEALAEYAELLELVPRDAEARVARGFLLLRLGEHDAALADFEATLELDPGFPWSYAGRAHLRVLSDDLVGALEDFQQAIALEPHPKFRLSAAETGCLLLAGLSDGEQTEPGLSREELLDLIFEQLGQVEPAIRESVQNFKHFEVLHQDPRWGELFKPGR